MMNTLNLYTALTILAALAIGWVAGRRAPDGIEYRAWLRLCRRSRRLRHRKLYLRLHR